jgi:hypothetical protein
MSGEFVRDPMADAGYRAAVRRAATHGISLSADQHKGRWTVIATHRPTGTVTETAAALLALAAWQALEQLRPIVEADRLRADAHRAAAPRDRRRGVVVQIDLLAEACELLTSVAEAAEPPDPQHARAVAASLRARLAKATR